MGLFIIVLVNFTFALKYLSRSAAFTNRSVFGTNFSNCEETQ